MYILKYTLYEVVAYTYYTRILTLFPDNIDSCSYSKYTYVYMYNTGILEYCGMNNR